MKNRNRKAIDNARKLHVKIYCSPGAVMVTAGISFLHGVICGWFNIHVSFPSFNNPT
jgi:hypothetical protein